MNTPERYETRYMHSHNIQILGRYLMRMILKSSVVAEVAGDKTRYLALPKPIAK